MSQEIQARDKMAAATEGEPTRPELVFVPSVDIFEAEDSLTLLADLPGVTRDGLTIDLKDNVLTLKGVVKPALPANCNVLYREYQEGDYYRQFSISDAIDQQKISAILKDGVLNLTLPKVEKPKPRTIEVKSE